MDKSFVSDVVWVARGVAKAVPEKVELEEKDLNELLQGACDETSDDDSDVDMSQQKSGLRGSLNDVSTTVDGIEKYGLDDYDDEDKDGVKGPTLKGLAYYANPLLDPHMTTHVDSEEEEEREDFEVKPTDNYVVVAKLVKEEPSLEVYVYNDTDEDWYLHHDYVLEVPALCLAAFTYDPGAENKTGNLVAVGTMDSTISIWDLDIVNSVTPVLTLGEKKKRTSKRKKKAPSSINKKRTEDVGEPSTTSIQHSDAVLSLAWNTRMEHVLASAGTDETVVLWDLDEAKGSLQLRSFNGMVQSIQWHTAEESILLCGTRRGQIVCADCRTAESGSISRFEWSIGADVEVERVLWDRFDPFSAFVSASDGKIRCLDMRKPGEFLTVVDAHEGGVNGLSQSYKTRGLLVTVGDDEMKVWKVGEDHTFRLIKQRSMNMGTLNVASFSPDSASVVALASDAEELVRIVDLSSMDEVVAAFG